MTNQTNITQPTTQQPTTTTSWLDDESEELSKGFSGERLPYMKFVENEIAEIEIDFSKPFGVWSGQDKGGKETTKAIIPVTHKGEKKNWWLNKRNPSYREVVDAGKKGQTHFKILQTGTQQNTKYVLVK